MRGKFSDFEKYHLQFRRSALNRSYKTFPRFFRQGGLAAVQVPFQRHSVISVKGIGKFRFKDNREGLVKSARVVHTPLRVEVQFIRGLPDIEARPVGDVVGIDVGIKAMATLSNSVHVARRVVDRSRRKALQKRVSRAVRGSVSRRGKFAALSRESCRLAQREHGHLHELAASLEKTGSRCFAEDIKTRNLASEGGSRKRGLNRSMLVRQWGTFIDMLACKAESAGSWLLKAPPHNVSRVSRKCGGFLDKPLSLKDRVCRCRHCGWEGDRDVNASRNVLERTFPFCLAGIFPMRGESAS